MLLFLLPTSTRPTNGAKLQLDTEKLEPEGFLASALNKMIFPPLVQHALLAVLTARSIVRSNHLEPADNKPDLSDHAHC